MREVHKIERTRGLSGMGIWPHDRGKVIYKIWDSRRKQYGLSYYMSESAALKMMERSNER